MLWLALPLALLQGPDSLAPRLDALITPYVGAGLYAGVVRASVAGEIRYERAFGLASVEHAAPVRADTRFRIASISKPVTAAAIGTLVRDGQLTLDDPIAKWLPQIPNAERITVRQLVTHRSGILHINSAPWYLDRMTHDFPLDTLVAWIAAEPPVFPPDSMTQYSNGGYALLAAIIERLSGESYIAYVQRRVLVPLGMRSTGEEQAQEIVHGLADGYQPGLGARDLARATYVAPSIKVGGGSLYATAADLERFARAIGAGTLLSRQLWDELVGGSPVLYFSGRAPGYNSVLMYDRRTDAVVAVLSNNYAISANSLAGQVMAAMTSGTPPSGTFPDLGADAPEAASRYVGRYRWPAPFDNAFTLELVDDRLQYDPDGRPDERSGIASLAGGSILIRMYDARCQRSDAGLTCTAPWAGGALEIPRTG